MRVVGVLLLCMALLGIAGCAQSEPVPGDSEFDPLGSSSPAESVARATRLAGFDEVIVGLDGKSAIVWLEVPSVNSAADVEIAWQTGMAALAANYPSAKEYVVQIATDRDLLELAIRGEDGRAAVEEDDAHALRGSATFTYASGSENLRGLPGDSYDGSVPDVLHYLDQKNRSAGLVGDGELLIEQADALETATAEARETVPGIPAVDSGGDAVAVWVSRTEELLQGSSVLGAEELTAERLAEGSSAERERAQAAREWFHVVSSVESEAPYGSVLGLVGEYAQLTKGGEVSEGPQADAILVAIRDRGAADSARVVSEFARVPSGDTDGGGEAALLPDHVVETNGGEGAVIAYMAPSGPEIVETDVWLAYDRADGKRFWLAGEDGAAALTDGSLHGWAFTRDEAALVDAFDVGAWLETFPAR